MSMSGSTICPDLNANKPTAIVRFRRNSTSTIFATETVSHPDTFRTLYYIAYILQADIFEAVSAGMLDTKWSPRELIILPVLPANIGGNILPREIPREVLLRETAEDPVLRVLIEAGTLPTVDTIFRFLKYYFTSVAPATKCNIMAFLYIKRVKAVCNFTSHNWRGLWIGAMIVAQKEIGMPISPAHLTTILPGVNAQQLLALENTMRQLLNRNINISPSAFIQAHLNLRFLFNSVLQERRQTINLRPLHSHSPIVSLESSDHREACRSKSVDSAVSRSQGALFILS